MPKLEKQEANGVVATAESDKRELETQTPSDPAVATTPPCEFHQDPIEIGTVVEMDAVERLIVVPFPKVEEQTWGLHVNAQLNAKQSNILRRLTRGFDQAGATLANGRRVVNATDAVKYLLELIAQAN